MDLITRHFGRNSKQMDPQRSLHGRAANKVGHYRYFAYPNAFPFLPHSASQLKISVSRPVPVATGYWRAWRARSDQAGW